MTKSLLKEKPTHRYKSKKEKRFRYKFPKRAEISKTLSNNETQRLKVIEPINLRISKKIIEMV